MATVLAWADLQARLTAAAITVNGTLLPIAWPNTTFNAPTGTPAPWLMVEIAGGSGVPIEVGGGIWQDLGRSFVHVLVPSGTGTADANEIVDQVIAMFRSPPLEPVVYLDVSADPGGPGTDDGLYWRTSVTAGWRLQTRVPRS